MAPNVSSRQKRGLNISLFQVLLVLGLIVGVSVILDLNQRMRAAQTIIAEAERVDGDVTALAFEQVALQTTLEYVKSDAYVEDWAYSDGQLVRPGDVLVVPVTKPGAPPPATPAPPPPAPVQIANWELWWEIFFEYDANLGGLERLPVPGGHD